MSSSMTPMEVGILLVQFSAVPDSERPKFLRQHPEILSAWVVDWALTAARLREQMGEPEAKTRLTRAALYIATELGDHERQAAAREILAGHSDQDREHRTFHMEAVASEEPSLPTEQTTIQTSDDRTVRRVPPRTKALVASATELIEKPSLGTAIRLMLRHPSLIPQAFRAAISFVLAALRDPVQARQQIEHAMAGAMDETSLARARELAQQARLEGDRDTAQRLARLPAGIEALRDRLSTAVSKAFTFEVFNLLSAVASAGSDNAARQVVRNWIQVALQSEFLPALMQVRQIYSRPPDLAPNLDALCALILDEVNQSLAEMELQTVGTGGACTALMLADSLQALEAAISRYRPLIDKAFYDELGRMSESFEARGLSEFAAQPRLLANLIREYVSAPDEGLGSLTLDPQTLALLHVSFASTEEEAWAAVKEEPGLLSESAIQQLKSEAAFQTTQGNPQGGRRLRRVADWLDHWRSELADPERNIVSRLADQVRTGELTLGAALAELEKPGALASLSIPHLGAVDERVIELRAWDLRRAETLAVLNDAAARRVGEAKIRAYAALSLAELRISRGAAGEALQALEEALEQAQQAEDPRLELRALGTRGLAYQQLGRFREAAAYHQDALELARRMNSDADQMPCLDSLGYIYGVLGDTEQAFACVREGYEIARRSGDRHSEAKFLGTMAALSRQTGRFHEAVEQFTQALDVFREARDTDNEARAMGNLGQIYIDLGELQKARESVEKSLALAQSMGIRSVEMNAWNSLGEIELRQGRIQQAIEHFQQSLAIAMEIGDQRTEAISQNNLGVIHTRLNQWDQAGRYLEDARDIARQIGDRRLEGSASLNLGNNYGSQGLWIWATDRYQTTLNIARELGDRHLEAQALGSLGRAYEQQDYFQAALTEYEQALKLYREIGDRQGEAVTLGNIANSYTGLGQFEQALIHYNQALSIARDLENPDLFARIVTGRGHTHTRMGRYADACDDYRESIEHIEKTRSSLVEEEHRMGYFGWDKMGVYVSLIMLLGRRDRCWNPGEALEVVERSRSRSFLDQLGYTELWASHKVDPVLLTHERELAIALRGKTVTMQQAKTEEQRQKLADQVAKLQAEWNVALDQMQKQVPEYGAAWGGGPTTYEEIRSWLQPVTD